MNLEAPFSRAETRLDSFNKKNKMSKRYRLRFSKLRLKKTRSSVKASKPKRMKNIRKLNSPPPRQSRFKKTSRPSNATLKFKPKPAVL